MILIESLYLTVITEAIVKSGSFLDYMIFRGVFNFLSLPYMLMRTLSSTMTSMLKHLINLTPSWQFQKNITGTIKVDFYGRTVGLH